MSTVEEKRLAFLKLSDEFTYAQKRYEETRDETDRLHAKMIDKGQEVYEAERAFITATLAER